MCATMYKAHIYNSVIYVTFKNELSFIALTSKETI